MRFKTHFFRSRWFYFEDTSLCTRKAEEKAISLNLYRGFTVNLSSIDEEKKKYV